MKKKHKAQSQKDTTNDGQKEALEQAAALIKGLAMLTPLQYANLMIDGVGLDLPKPYLPAMKKGRFEVIHVPHKKGEVLDVIDLRMAIQIALPMRSITLKKRWTEMVFQMDGKRWMSTHPIEIFTHIYPYNIAHGDVLIGGLGMGYILQKLTKNSKVKSITCVEKEGDLIDFLRPHFPNVIFVHDDIHKYLERDENRDKFDFVYLDTWGNDSEGEFYKNVAPLRAKAKNVLRSTWERKDLVCWMEEVMRGQIAKSIQKQIEEKFDINVLSAEALAERRGYQPANMDFFAKFGVLEPGEETNLKVAEFVRDWEMQLPS